MSKPRHPKVTLRKLGRERAWGLYSLDEIEIDPRTTGKARLEVLIHEYDHHLDPSLPEKTVASNAKKLTDFLHKHHVRIIEPNNKGLNE